MINLNRFIDAQKDDYQRALTEIVNEKRTSNWMWYVFPEFKKLSKSSTTVFYALKSKEEAIAYLHHEVLGPRLIEISKALLDINVNLPDKIFSFPNLMKLKSSMTLFVLLNDGESVFQEVLDKYFDGKMDQNVKELFDSQTL